MNERKEVAREMVQYEVCSIECSVQYRTVVQCGTYGLRSAARRRLEYPWHLNAVRAVLYSAV